MMQQAAAPVHVFGGIEELLSGRPPHVRHGIESIGLAAEYFSHYTNRTMRLHSPAIVLFSFIVRGHCWHVMGDDVYEETGGSVGITHYGQCHDIITDEQGADVINLYLDLTRCPLPHLPRELERVLPNVLPLHPCFQNRLNQRIRLVFDDPAAAAGKLFNIERELQERNPGYLETALLYFKLFLIDCCRQAITSGVTLDLRRARPRDTRLEELRRHLENNFNETMTLPALAQRVGVTPVYLCRAFKEYTGRSIFDYLLHRRIQEAMIRLRSNTEKISTIALECGFNDLSYFNRKFKAMVGKSPAVYRKCTPSLLGCVDASESPHANLLSNHHHTQG